MRTQQEVSREVDRWIAEEELPPSAALKVIRPNDLNYGLSEDEIDERNEFIQWYLMQDYVLILSLPKKDSEYDFFVPDCDPGSEEYSAMNTHDFQDGRPEFNRYGYAMKKIMERVKDLAILHSCISSSEGRAHTYERFLSLVDYHFRERLLALVERYSGTRDPERKDSIKRKVGELNRRILECEMTWERFAPRDT